MGSDLSGYLGYCWSVAVAALPSKGKALMEKLNRQEKDVKTQELAWAWKTLVDAGPKGVSALKEEFKKVEE